MLQLLRHYTNPNSPDYGRWIDASRTTARGYGKPSSYGRPLRKWCRAFLKNGSLPTNRYSSWNTSVLHTDEDLRDEVISYLQGVGKFVSADDIVLCVSQEHLMRRLRRQKPISRRTAQRWMAMMGFRWRKEPKGQYVDGHERDDVVDYRQKQYLPAIAAFRAQTREWDVDGNEVVGQELEPESQRDGPSTPPVTASPPPRRVVIWFHDESIFYAHDRRKIRWVHSSETAKPYAKGEGQSFMVADFVSADYGWLRGPNGESARRSLKPGKNREGYFSNDNVLEQVEAAIDLAKKLYPDDEHVFVFDNARTHSKRAEDALSARHLPKSTSQPDSNWMLKRTRRDPNGKPMYDSTGELLKEKIPMGDARFADGRPQPLYFPPNHPTHPGLFKGMAVILKERGFTNADKLRYECKGFKCEKQPDGEYGHCCCRRVLFNQPDFVNVPSLLLMLCERMGVKALFLPKFHPELNFIEQCWGYAKRVYREFPASSKMEDLERNALTALDQVPLDSMRRFANRSRRYEDAYIKGLDGSEAAWASRRYHGHRGLPAEATKEMIAEQMRQKHL
ncbi:hypothetical protein DL93DRAFT_2136065 [Clavulina sp. PMI_390]|nr:hypothetical protein DL93DRAFT_2136065 [Clavulina sp. PMI_390]